MAALKAKTEGQQQRLAELEAAVAVHADAADRLASAKVSHSSFGLGRSLALPASRRISGDFLEGAERVGLRVGHAYRRLQLFYSGRAHASCFLFLIFFSLCARRRRWCCVCVVCVVPTHPSPHQASVAQRDALLRSAKDQAAAAAAELEAYRAEAAAWRRDAEHTIRAGSRRVDQAEARAHQAEANASLGRVSAQDNAALAAARAAAVAELQRLRVAVRSVAQHLLDARNKSAAAAAAAADAADDEEGGRFGGLGLGLGSSSSGGSSSSSGGGDGRVGGLGASVGGLGASELRAMLGAVSGGAPPPSADAAAAFHRELTAILDAPLDEEALRGVLIALAEERARLDAQGAAQAARGEWAGASRHVVFR